MTPPNFIDLTGQRFHKLVVQGRATSNDKWNRARWDCICDCGNRIIVAGQALRSGRTISCKCWQQARRTKHGLHQTREYRAWIDAKSRCTHKNHPGFKHWGGRGVTMCDKWNNDFEAFLLDVGICPQGYSLDRYPNQDGNYEPGNCRWASRVEQNRNTRRNCLLTYNGVVRPLSQWCEELGINDSTLWARLFVWHWPIERAFIPIKK